MLLLSRFPEVWDLVASSIGRSGSGSVSVSVIVNVVIDRTYLYSLYTIDDVVTQHCLKQRAQRTPFIRESLATRVESSNSHPRITFTRLEANLQYQAHSKNLGSLGDFFYLEDR